MLKLNIRKYFIFIVVIGLLIFLHFTGILFPLESLVSCWLNPLFKNFYSLGSSLRTNYGAKSSQEELLNKIGQLERQNTQLTLANAKLKIAEEENQVLRQSLKFLAKSQFHYTLANIISRGESVNLFAGSQTAVIDKGSADGLFPGLPVVSPAIYDPANQGLIIGKVVAVKNNISEICFITNQDCKLAVSLFNQTNTSGIAHGELGLTVRMEFIPQTEIINIGDLVITSGLEQNIPRGLVIGKISEINKASNELWQNATIKPLQEIDDLIIVTILLP